MLHRHLGNYFNCSLTRGFIMNTKNSALLIIDGQNDFLTEGGALYEAVRPVADENNLLQNLNDAIAKARLANLTIINTAVAFSDGYAEAGDSPYGIFAAVAQSGGFIKGTWGAQSAEGLNLLDEDIFLEKAGMNAFLNKNLNKILEEKNITNIVLAGLLTDACVECTMRYAYDNGFEVSVLTDATATIDPDKQKSTIENSFPLFSKPMTTEQFA